MSGFKTLMSVIEEKLESSDDEGSTSDKKSTGSKVRFDECAAQQNKIVYIAIEGDLSGEDSFVFGLGAEDADKVVEVFPREPEVVTNGLCIKGSVIAVVNMLHQLGYLVVDIAGTSTKTWTMVKKNH